MYKNTNKSFQEPEQWQHSFSLIPISTKITLKEYSRRRAIAKIIKPELRTMINTLQEIICIN